MKRHFFSFGFSSKNEAIGNKHVRAVKKVGGTCSIVQRKYGAGSV